ncbi:MAG: ABC transporter ATP-binding protein [Actinomycetota bacterium]
MSDGRVQSAAEANQLRVADRTETWRHVRALLRPRRRAAIVVVVLAVLVTLASASVPLIIGAAVDLAIDADDDTDRGRLAWLAGGVVVVTFGGALAQMVGRYRAAQLGEAVLNELRRGVYDAVVRLPAATVERVGTGELVARTTGDVEVLANATRSTVPMLFIGSILSVGLAVGLFATDARLAAVGIIAAAVVAYPGVRWYARHAPPRYAHQRQVEGERSAALLETYNGRQTLWAFGGGVDATARLDGHGEATLAAGLSTTAARNRLRPALRIGQGVAVAAVLLLGADLLDAGTVSAGTVTAATFFMLRLMDPVSMLVEQLDTIQQAQAALARIVGVIGSVDDEASLEGPPAATNQPDGAAIDIRNLSFSYRPGVPVLTNVDLDIAAGSRVVVVGPSGAGKSTLARLLCSIEQPDQGSIRIGGVALDAIDPAERSRTIALVAQETHVFERSVAENVALGRPEARAEQVAEALRVAGASGWVEQLEDGVDTVVGPEHPAITAARAQQLNLARILCLDPAVLVLDEATADLDPLTASATERQVDEALRGRTVVTIAHRLDAAERADLVVVIDEGRVVDLGSHDELVAADGPYAALWANWSRSRHT